MNKDVIIVGGGIIGCSIAWQLSKKGQKVLVIERKDMASGAAGATDGVVGYHTKKPGKQMDLAVRSIEMFGTLSKELGEDIEFEKNAGGMQPVENEIEWNMLNEIVEEQKKSGVDIQMISKDEAKKIEPQLADNIYGALYSPTGGKVNPLKLTMAFANAAKRLGAEILIDTEVTGFILEDKIVKGVKTSRGEFFAEKVVVSSGAWSGEVASLAGLNFPIKPRKGQLAVTEPIGPFMKATLQCARYNIIKFKPEMIDDEAILRVGASLSIEQTEEGGLIIGGTREFVDYEEENTFEAIEMMMRRAIRFFPSLADVSVIRYFAGFRPFTPDGMPLLGKVDGLDGFYMAAGHEGDGIALAPITGLLMSELIVDGSCSFDLTSFSPNRFGEA